MKQTITKFLVLVMMSFYTLAYAQSAHWTCNIYQYQYDMTVYAQFKQDDAILNDIAKYEFAAFCGNECRGVAELNTVGETSYYYLRVRSNQESGESITFKSYDKQTGKENVAPVLLTFTSNGQQGLPSSPYLVTFKSFIPGDVNGDNVISPVDITMVINYYLGNTSSSFNFSAGDMNGDGVISPTDITKIINVYLNNN